MSKFTVKTPCIGRCSTVYGDIVCRGCKRFDHEIINWNNYSTLKKQAIWHRLQDLLEQVMQTKLIINDIELLQKKLTQHNIRFYPEQSNYYSAYQLLAKGARYISNIKAYGIEILPTHSTYTLNEIRDNIDKEFFELSTQHYVKELPV